jgi:hypothetical protein
MGVSLAALLKSPRRIGAQALRFLRTMAVFWAVTVALCLEWGRIQTGPLYDFNGHFYFSVIFGAGLMICALAAEAIPQRSLRSAGWIMVGVAIVAAVSGLRIPATSPADSDLPLRDAALAALRADGRPGAPKLLVFAHDDWGPAASVALALERAGATVYVDPAWTFMFQAAHALPDGFLQGPQADVSVWRFVHGQSGGPGIPAEGGLRIVFRPATLSPDGGFIDFSMGGNMEGYVLCGLSTPGSNFAWTSLPDVTLQFRPMPSRHDVLLRLKVTPFLVGSKLPTQPLEFWLNGVLLSRAVVAMPEEIQALAPRDLWNDSANAFVRLHLSKANSPARLGLNGDTRLLALRVMSLTAFAP